MELALLSKALRVKSDLLKNFIPERVNLFLRISHQISRLMGSNDRLR